MKCKINISAIERNIKKAQTLVEAPIALMFKDFYQHIYKHLSIADVRCFGISLYGSICYALGKAGRNNSGAFVVTNEEVKKCYSIGMRIFYVPINAHDNREGLSLSEAINLLTFIRSAFSDVLVYGLITSGCLNDNHPSNCELEVYWSGLGKYLDGLSLGGSFWLARMIPPFVTEIRIGEYMLFGTIPYYDGKSLLGENGIELVTKVLAVYPDRCQIIVDCGYSKADMMECKPLKKDLHIIDCSSEYTMIETGVRYQPGDEIRFVPNYKSLVKLRYARTEYVRE